jgi:hypothetical protein
VTSRLPRLRWRWIVLVVVLVLALGVVRLADKSFPIYDYRVIDDHTIVIGTVTGPWTWTRVTTVTETTSSVTVGVSSISAPGPGFGDDILELTVTLRDPIGDRTVIDASDGLPVRRT